MDFSEFNLSEPLAEALDHLGFTKPTPIQEKSLPPLLAGRDVIGKAETGSGKTLAFGLPMMERIDGGRVSIQSLVICPTRELAQQVADGLRTVGEKKGIGVVLVTGGEHIRTQRMRIPGNQVVVGTPGRLLDLLEDRFLPVEWAEYVVLDEFDRLLDMGFIADIQKIFKRLPNDRQTALFSATVPNEVMRHARKLMKDPLTVETSKGITTVARAEQRVIRTRKDRKIAVLERLLFAPGHEEDTVIVFCNTKREVRHVDRELWVKDLSVGSLSGDYEQSVRFKVMARFREKEIRILVATDVAARGLDIDHVAHVINYDVPFEVDDYVHRIGRTARAGRSGLVTTLVSPQDSRSMERIARAIDQPIEDLPESLKPRARRTERQNTEKNGPNSEGTDTQTKARAEEAQEKRPADGRSEEESRGGRGRGRGRGRGERSNRSSEGVNQEKEPQGGVQQDTATDDDSSRGRGSRRGGRGRSRRRDNEQPKRDDRQSGSQPSRGRRNKPTDDGNSGGDRGRRGRVSGAGSRRRGDYQKMEEERLNRPIELIPDEEPPPQTPEKAPKVEPRQQRKKKKTGGRQGSSGRGDRKPTEGGESTENRNSGGRKKRSRRRGRRGGKPSNKNENSSPSEGSSGDADIVW